MQTIDRFYRARKAKTNLLPEKDENLSPMMKIRSLMKGISLSDNVNY